MLPQASRSRPTVPRWVAASLVLGFCLQAAPPRVARVEPPNWWVDHPQNPVRLLITGEHLAGAGVTAPEGFTLDAVRVSPGGGYLFCNLTIPAGARAGSVQIEITTAEGTIELPFDLLPPVQRVGGLNGFTPDDVIYLAMIDRFANGDLQNDDPPVSPGLLDRSKPRHYHGGDFRGLEQRLGYLRDLGVTALWLTPWYDNVNQLNRREQYTTDNRLSTNGVPSTDYHGYGAVDFYGVEERFGDLRELQRLVSEAHRGGIRVIQDQVANHTGPYHPWVAHPPTPTWYHGTREQHLDNGWHTWTTVATNPPPDKLKSTLDGWFLNILPDLNQDDPEVATYLIQNSLWWVGQTGVDAVRQDTLPYVPRSYWAQWTAALKRAHPGVTVLGEFFEGDPDLVSFFQGGRAEFDGVDTGVDTLFDFPLFYAIRDVFAKGQPMTRLTDTLAADAKYVDASVLVTFLGLHDTPRFLHEPGATVDGLKLAFTYLLTMRGTPMIYYGDEIGMNGGKDPYNRADFPGGWPDDEPNAFEPEGRTVTQASVHAHVQTLLRLRAELEPLRRGRWVNLVVGPDTHAFGRTTADSQVVVALNNAAEPRKVRVPVADVGWTSGELAQDRLGALGLVRCEDGLLQLELPARGAAILTPAGSVVRVQDAAGAGSRAPKDLSAE